MCAIFILISLHDNNYTQKVQKSDSCSEESFAKITHATHFDVQKIPNDCYTQCADKIKI